MHTLAAYTTNSWVSPLAILRLVGPARHAGRIPNPGNEATFSALNCELFVETIAHRLPPWEYALRLAMAAPPG